MNHFLTYVTKISKAGIRFEFSPTSVRIIFKFHVDVYGLSPYEYIERTHFQGGLKFGDIENI